MFPQSIHMTKKDKIKLTKDSFTQHKNLQLAGRDQHSFDWLKETFGPSEQNDGKDTGVKRVLSPDIVFMFGNRPEFREEKKE
jgi:exopolysaccharide biosynthesis predicted pyruvyltransferase EpsI